MTTIRSRRNTILEAASLPPVEFSQLAKKWSIDYVSNMLAWVWQGYVRLLEESSIDATKGEEDLEREISELLDIRIRDSMPAFSPMYLQHESKERETRSAPPAQPPEYDLAFVLRGNEQVKWPLEAKVLKTDQQVSRYVASVQEDFLTCKYAPFSGEGAMLGYLLCGEPLEALKRIGKGLGSRMFVDRPFKKRCHRRTKHARTVPRGKDYPQSFTCYHLIMCMHMLLSGFEDTPST